MFRLKREDYTKKGVVTTIRLLMGLAMICIIFTMGFLSGRIYGFLKEPKIIKDWGLVYVDGSIQCADGVSTFSTAGVVGVVNMKRLSRFLGVSNNYSKLIEER